MNDTKGRLPIPKTARIEPYYDTQQIKQNEATVDFFPANASKDITRNNYVSNPFPGNAVRRVAGLSFEVVKHFLIDDPGNSINARAIVNALKHASVIITADQDYHQFLREPIEEYSNFDQTRYVGASGKAYVNGAYVDNAAETAIIKAGGMHRLDDPFDIEANQNVNVTVQFNDASNFPTEAQWTAASQGFLWMRATLYLAEIDAG